MDEEWREFIKSENRKKQELEKIRAIWRRYTSYYGERPTSKDAQNSDVTFGDNDQEKRHGSTSGS